MYHGNVCVGIKRFIFLTNLPNRMEVPCPARSSLRISSRILSSGSISPTKCRLRYTTLWGGLFRQPTAPCETKHIRHAVSHLVLCASQSYLLALTLTYLFTSYRPSLAERLTTISSRHDSQYRQVQSIFYSVLRFSC